MDEATLAGQGLVDVPKSPRSPPNPIRVIEVLTYPAAPLLDLTGTVQVFDSTNGLFIRAGGSPPHRLKVVAAGGRGVTASGGVTLAAESAHQRRRGALAVTPRDCRSRFTF